MLRRQYAAFLSYSSRHRSWVEALQWNLETCLRAEGETRPIALDCVDLPAGGSWINHLQKTLEGAERLVLIATPESLASPWVEAEWQALTARDGWRPGSLQLVTLVATPLPPFLQLVQQVDFLEHDADKYHDALGRLVGGLLGEDDQRHPVDGSTDLKAPEPPRLPYPQNLREEALDLLEPQLTELAGRVALGSKLKLEPLDVLEPQPTARCAASAALVLAEPGNPEAAFRRTLRTAAQLWPTAAGEAARELLERARGRRRQPLADVLGAYLAGVSSDHQQLAPFFHHRGSPFDLLERVYVPLELRHEPETRSTATSPEMRQGGEKDRPEPTGSLHLHQALALEPTEYPWVTRRWVIRGDPGSGKTTLLRHLAAQLAGEPEAPWLPVLESLPRWLQRGGWLFDPLEERLRGAGYPGGELSRQLEEAARNGRLLLLLDGLDEVSRESRGEADGRLRQLSLRWPKTPILVASRPIGFHSPAPEFQVLELQPLSRDQRLRFLEHCLCEKGEGPCDRAQEALAALAADSGLWELSGNPLYLTLLTLLFLHLAEGESLERRRARLYDQVFDLLLDGKHRDNGKPIEFRAGVQSALRFLAYGMTLDDLDAEPVGKLEKRLYQGSEADRIREPLLRVQCWHGRLRPFFDDVAELTGILGPHGGPETNWRYWHRTFREALAAEQLEELIEREGQQAVLAHAREVVREGDESRWAEPYALLAGRVEKADELVRSLVRENRALGLRAVATAQGLSEETLHEVLELSEQWQERAKVYGRIPELVGEPDRALALLERLRRGTHDGNDLYFLDLALAETGSRWPEHTARVEEFRARLFDHIPAPKDETLFERVETPLDGPVALWCDLPEGTFLMGSPDDEGNNDEHPRHEVRIAAPFRLGAVPVTNAQYAAFDPHLPPQKWEGVAEPGLAHHPRVRVTWFAAISFCRWLAATFPWARGARLPSEEEWEYACRAGSTTRYWMGDKEKHLEKVGWYTKNSSHRTERVGRKPANPWGFYDVHGNVLEWTLSRYEPDLYASRQEGVTIDPRKIALETADLDAATSGDGRVMRGGGCWDSA